MANLVTLYRDVYGIHFIHAMSDGRCAIYRPVPSTVCHTPVKAFGKLREVPAETAFNDGMYVSITFYGGGAAIVHTKNPRYGKTGRREVWALHGIVGGNQSSEDAWSPYESSGVPEISRGPRPDAVVSPVKQTAPGGPWARTNQFIQQLRSKK